MAFDFEFNDLLRQVWAAIDAGTQSQLDALSTTFTTPIANLVKSQWVTSNCSDIFFINYTPLSVLTNGSVFVNNYELQPGGFYGVSGNNAEINTDTYNVVFGSAATKCVVIKKLYTKK
jgi:hypothetical protein